MASALVPKLSPRRRLYFGFPLPRASLKSASAVGKRCRRASSVWEGKQGSEAAHVGCPAEAWLQLPRGASRGKASKQPRARLPCVGTSSLEEQQPGFDAPWRMVVMEVSRREDAHPKSGCPRASSINSSQRGSRERTQSSLETLVCPGQESRQRPPEQGGARTGLGDRKSWPPVLEPQGGATSPVRPAADPAVEDAGLPGTPAAPAHQV